MDSPDAIYAIQLFVLFILLLFSALFSSAETARMTLNRICIRTLAGYVHKRERTVNCILEDQDQMPGAILIGNHIVNHIFTVKKADNNRNARFLPLLPADYNGFLKNREENQ